MTSHFLPYGSKCIFQPGAFAYTGRIVSMNGHFDERQWFFHKCLRFFSYFPALEKRNELSKFIRGSGNCPRGSSPAYAGLSGIWSLKERGAGFFCAYAQKKKDLPFQYLCAILKTGNDPGRKTACVLIYPFGFPLFGGKFFFRKSSLPAGKRIWIMV